MTLSRGSPSPAPFRATEKTIPRPPAKAAAIRRLNDQFRSTFIGGEIVLTDGFRDLPPEDQVCMLSLVRTFNQFAYDNDPYGEHDFGKIEHAGERVYFKIDYYDKNFAGGSEDPADPAQTCRLMTIMLAHEY